MKFRINFRPLFSTPKLRLIASAFVGKSLAAPHDDILISPKVVKSSNWFYGFTVFLSFSAGVSVVLAW
jgi:hypothetical protein